MLSAQILGSLKSLHIEAIDWHNRVVSNGGSVSPTTLKAVSNFCRSIDGAGIRSKFSRLNLICGNNSIAARVPLYRGLSFTGTQYGNSIDTNYNFVSSDYTEKGSSGGLNAGEGQKFLDTGLTVDGNCGFTATNVHMSAYIMNRDAVGMTGQYYFSMGVYDDFQQCYAGHDLYLEIDNTNNSATMYIFEQNTPNPSVGSIWSGTFGGIQNGLYLGCFNTDGDNIDSTTYLNGLLNNDNTFYDGTISDNLWSSFNQLKVRIFGYAYTTNPCPSLTDQGAGHISSYSIGKSLNDTEQHSYYNILQNFQKILGRDK